MSVLARVLAIFCVALGTSVIEPARVRSNERLVTEARVAIQVIQRHPRKLRAAQWLGESSDGYGNEPGSRVRFEWDPVPGVRAYVLRGRWTGRESWAVRAVEYRVTPRNASCWESRRVAFDVALVPGSHSWQVVALHGADEAGDFENATRLAFEVR